MTKSDDRGQRVPSVHLHSFNISVDHGDTAVRRTLADLLTRIEPLALTRDEIGTVELVVAEVLNNILEHAYPPDLTSRPIHVYGEHKSDGLHMQITDEGDPMPDGQLPPGVRPDINVDPQDLPEGGFGWFLIKDLAQDVGYSRSGKKNVLRFLLPVGLRS